MRALLLTVAASWTRSWPPSNAQPATADWAQWGRNPQQQAAHTAAARPAAILSEWQFNASDRIVSSPAVAFGRVYVGSDDGHLYCLDALSGRVVWSFAVPDLDPTCKSNCDPEVDPACDPDPEHPDDKGFQCEHGLCLCTKIRSDPAIDSDGNIYFGGAWNPITPATSTVHTDTYAHLRWWCRLPACLLLLLLLPTLDTAAYNRQFYKISPHGQLVWNVTTGGTIYGPPTIDTDGTVYIGSFDLHIYAIAASGQTRWKKFIGAHGDSGIAIGEGAHSNVLMTQVREL